MNQAIKSLPKNSKLLSFKHITSQERLKRKNPYQNELEISFYNTQQKILGYQAVELYFESGEILNTESFKAQVVLGKDLVEEIMSDNTYKNPKALMNFVMIHELSHVFQTFLAEEFPLDINLDQYVAYHVKHLEVDVYALLILKQLNEDLPDLGDVSRLFHRLARPKDTVFNAYQNMHKFDNHQQENGRCSDEMRLDYLQKFK